MGVFTHTRGWTVRSGSVVGTDRGQRPRCGARGSPCCGPSSVGDRRGARVPETRVWVPGQVPAWSCLGPLAALPSRVSRRSVAPWVPVAPVALARHLHTGSQAWPRLLSAPGAPAGSAAPGRESATSPGCSGTRRASRLAGGQAARLCGVVSGPRPSSLRASPWAVSGLGSLAKASRLCSLRARAPPLRPAVCACPCPPAVDARGIARTCAQLCACLGAARFGVGSCSFQSLNPSGSLTWGPGVPLHPGPRVLRSPRQPLPCASRLDQSWCWSPAGAAPAGPWSRVARSALPPSQAASWTSEPPTPCSPAGGEGVPVLGQPGGAPMVTVPCPQASPYLAASVTPGAGAPSCDGRSSTAFSCEAVLLCAVLVLTFCDALELSLGPDAALAGGPHLQRWAPWLFSASCRHPVLVARPCWVFPSPAVGSCLRGLNPVYPIEQPFTRVSSARVSRDVAPLVPARFPVPV